ncbi:GntR family transcriptional regulator [Luteimicrobium album]|uniref:GntR family transcriptional regulator n=1 Tax=Luteimicrobium album TaxID=1054550 RepID=A0ABQ6I0K9_9MICO|nr:PLP-dependent aminotransferase family protein [Luteimicrobium album]GMA24281.1 GntR family transcriptional regulator [Luteimicrobium album]
MTETWATRAGLDLFLDPGAARGTRPRRALEDALRDAVRTGRLAPGTRVPSSRTLAADLGIARNTVAEVYGQLVAEGWFEARVGAGTWVGEPPRPAPRPAPPSRATRRTTDLRAGLPDGTQLPRGVWAGATRRALATLGPDDLGYTPRVGLPGLRAQVAEYVGRTRGVVATPDDVVVTTGFSETLALVCAALRASGARRLAIEEYGHEAHRAIVRASGLELQVLPVDEDGARVDLLDADAVLLTPAHQFPTGVPLAPARRVAVARWAEATDGLVVEDDYDGELRYDRRPVGALQALAPGHVVYAGTANKAFSPALGIGWAVGPGWLVAELDRLRAASGVRSDGLAQAVLADLLATHAYDRHVRRVRASYRDRRARLAAALADRVPDARLRGLPAGLHVVVELPDGVRASEAVAAGERHGVRFEALADFRAGGPGSGDPSDADERCVVVGFGAPPASGYAAAIDATVAVLAEAVRRSARPRGPRTSPR